MTQCMLPEMPTMIDGLPNICGHDEKVIPSKLPPEGQVYLPNTDIDFNSVKSLFSVALHMHQPTIPAGGGDIQTATMIGNLQNMFENQGIGDNHNASVFADCYRRIADFVRDLSGQGLSPRVMLDYSGNLFWNLEQMGRGDILDNLKSVACDPQYWGCVEFLGTMWGHAVASSTPVPDLYRHMVAWRHHYGAIFGAEALNRVRGFSPPEMHMPNDPDVAYAYVEALLKAGYTWLLVQEHTVENLDGSGIHRAHQPHQLVVKNLKGDTLSIAALIKTQGSDTKLVAQMQPLYEAQGLNRVDLNGVSVPQCVTQIGDGENGGVMMNEFPDGFRQGIQRVPRDSDVRAVNGTEYFEACESLGLSQENFIPIQPIWQHKIWEQYKGGGQDEVDKLKETLQQQDHRVHFDGGSWTNDLSWVNGYDNVLNPMQDLSVQFNAMEEKLKPDRNSREYRNALLHLLCAETSCFRYWGQGGWTDYAIEICRRGQEILKHDLGWNG